jgi:hypothetical protein
LERSVSDFVEEDGGIFEKIDRVIDMRMTEFYIGKGRLKKEKRGLQE